MKRSEEPVKVAKKAADASKTTILLSAQCLPHRLLAQSQQMLTSLPPNAVKNVLFLSCHCVEKTAADRNKLNNTVQHRIYWGDI